MDRCNRISQSIFACLTLAVVGAANAQEVWLCAGTTTLTMPGTNEVVTMWGFASDNDNNLLNGCGNAPQVPGPRITVPAGDPMLTIHLLNQLTEPMSVVIPGQTTTMTPVRNLDGRVRSFTHETPAGAQRDYVWSALTPGSYVYHSGTHPAVQVQMGLYGAMTSDSTLGNAYPGVPYANEVVMFYSEIDPALHLAVAGGTYGPGPVTNTTSTIDYKPRYFLVNGMPSSPTTPPVAAGSAGQRTLLRFFNMGLNSHAPILQGMHMSVIAEDGKPYPFAREQYSLMLAAGATADAIITPAAAGSYPLYDRTLALTNGPSVPGGLMSMLNVGGVVVPPPPATDTVTILRAAYDTVATQLNVWATTTDAVATISIVDPNGGPAVAMTYTADPSVLNGGYYSGAVLVATAPVSVTVNSSSGGADTNPVPSTEPPVANGDSYATNEDVALSILPSGVLGNDLSGGWVMGTEVLEAIVATPPTNGSVMLALDGSFTYTPNANFNGSDSFTYTATVVDIATNPVTVRDTSAAAAVNISITSVNDLPVALNNAYAVNQNTTLNVASPGVLANDSDVDNDPITAVLVSGPINGTLSLSTNGSFTYTPNTNYTGTDSFSYAANDGKGNGNTAAVSVTVNAAANQPPEAVSDVATTTLNTSVAINVLMNDIDPDNNLDPTTVTIAALPNRGGTVSVNAVTGIVTYTPALNFRGSDTFRYRVRDTAGAISNRATVRVNVR